MAAGAAGKTTAAALPASGFSSSVLLMDMDTRLGGVGIMLDVEAEYSVVDLARLVETLDRETFRAGAGAALVGGGGAGGASP